MNLEANAFGSNDLAQGWPHFLCGGHKSAPQKLAGTKICSKRLGGQNLTSENHTIEPIKA